MLPVPVSVAVERLTGEPDLVSVISEISNPDIFSLNTRLKDPTALFRGLETFGMLAVGAEVSVSQEMDALELRMLEAESEMPEEAAESVRR